MSYEEKMERRVIPHLYVLDGVKYFIVNDENYHGLRPLIELLGSHLMTENHTKASVLLIDVFTRRICRMSKTERSNLKSLTMS